MSGGTSTAAAATRGRRVLALMTLLLAAAALMALAIRDPRSYGLGPLCPSLRFAGVHCPGCGSMRATHDLMHGEVGSAFRNNPALPLLGVPVAAWWMVSTIMLIVAGRRPSLRVPVWTGFVIAAALVAWGFARNLPGQRFDMLRPPTARQSMGDAPLDQGP